MLLLWCVTHQSLVCLLVLISFQFRVSMAAIDPTAEAEREDVDDTSKPRATLKIVRFPYADSDLEDFDDDEDMEDSELLDGLDSDEDSSDEGINGGPSARKLVNGKTSKTKQILDKDDEDMEDPEDEDEDDEDDDEEQAKAILKKLMKGKAKADGADDSDDDEVDLDDDDELEIDETVVCTLDPEQVSSFSCPLSLRPRLTALSTISKPLTSTSVRVSESSSKSRVRTPFI